MREVHVRRGRRKGEVGMRGGNVRKREGTKEKDPLTFMVAEDLHAWFCVWVVCWLEAESVDTWEGEG